MLRRQGTIIGPELESATVMRGDIDPGDAASCSVLWVIQCGRVRRERNDRSGGFRSDGRGELRGVKCTPEVDLN